MLNNCGNSHEYIPCHLSLGVEDILAGAWRTDTAGDTLGETAAACRQVEGRGGRKKREILVSKQVVHAVEG